MRTIVKGAEPPSLTEHRLTPPSDGYKPDYDNYQDKDALRDVLVSEQRGLCGYCMGRIQSGPTKMKIEHWHCQSQYCAEQLNYRNLLAVCLGGEGQPQKLQHCDTRKGDQDLRWNPANASHRIETRLRYGPDGSIRSDDPTFDAQLSQVLNLNLPLLRNSRKGILDAVLGWWRLTKENIKGPVPRDRLERQRNRWIPQTGDLKPFCQIAVWWFDQKLKKMAT